MRLDLLQNRSSNPFGMPDMMYGSKPTDDGNFLFTDEKGDLQSSRFCPRVVPARRGTLVLWLVGTSPTKSGVAQGDGAGERRGSLSQGKQAASTRNHPHRDLFRQVPSPARRLSLSLATLQKPAYIP